MIDHDDDAPRTALTEAGALDFLRDRREGQSAAVEDYQDTALDAPKDSNGKPASGVWRPTPEARDRPFRDDREALEDARERARHRREDAAAAAEARAMKATEKAEADVRKVREWHPADAVQIEGLQARVQQFQHDQSQLAAVVQRTRGQNLTAEQRHAINGTAERLVAEKQFLAQAAGKVQTAASQKSAAADAAELRRVIPELNDPEFRDGFVAWTSERLGISESRVRAERDPTIIGPVVKDYQAHLKKQATERRRKETAAWSRKTFDRNPLSDDDVHDAAEARDRLARTGSPRDALLALTLKRRAG